MVKGLLNGPIKVLLVGPVPPSLGGSAIGGVATHVAGLARRLAELGTLDVHLLATGTSRDSWDQWRQAIDGYTLYRVGMPSGMSTWQRRVGRVRLYGFGTILEVGRTLARAMRVLKMYPPQERSLRSVISTTLLNRYLLDSIRPDIVHVHDAVSLTLGWHLAADRNTPVIATLHGISPVLEDHPERNLESVLRVNLRLPRACIAVNSHTREEAILLGASPERVVVIPNAIDCEEFAPVSQTEARRRLGLPDGPLALYCGQLIPRKNVAMLIDAFYMLLSEFPATRLVIVGDGPEKDRLKSSAVESGISRKVLFAGACPHDELKWWYNACDLVVLPSTSEGLPIVMLEAMACGKPMLVAAPAYGKYDPLIDGETGLVITPVTADQLARRIKELISDAQLSSQIGDAARRLMAREYDWSVVATRMAGFYREVVARARAEYAV